MSRQFDAAIIGTGQAAPALATALAARGERVIVFEGGLVGGSCVNVGCTPTKTLRKSARVAHMARRAREFGVHTGDVHVDFAAAMERVARVVESSREGLTKWVTGTKGVEFVPEFATLAGRAGDQFVVHSEPGPVHTSRVYLNTGTRPFIPPIPGLREMNPLTNDSIMELRELPTHMIIIGGSYIGLEFAQIFRRLGAQVTVIESAPAVAAREDDDVSARITQFLEDEGIRIHTSATVTSAHAVKPTKKSSAEESANLAAVSFVADGVQHTINGSHVLVATGRTPNTDALGLDTVGVATNERGFITTNGALESSVPGIWALGDINGRGAFTHTSYQDHEIVLANYSGGNRTADGRTMTYAMFTDPPLGRVGMSMREARALQSDGRRFLLATHEMSKVSRAKEEGETNGVIHVLVDAETQQFAGATILGIGGDEIVQMIGAQMAAGASYHVLKETLPVHPTVTEFFPTILGKLRPLA